MDVTEPWRARARSEISQISVGDAESMESHQRYVVFYKHHIDVIIEEKTFP